MSSIVVLLIPGLGASTGDLNRLVRLHLMASRTQCFLSACPRFPHLAFLLGGRILEQEENHVTSLKSDGHMTHV
jgi:hypothetical protein